MLRIAVVGADGRYLSPEDEERARRFIEGFLMLFLMNSVDVELVSGGCPLGGIDKIAEEVADRLGIPKTVFRPEGKGWRYYRERNLRIAEYCDVLLVVEPSWRRHSGGLWTGRMAYKLGKKVYEARLRGNSVELREW